MMDIWFSIEKEKYKINIPLVLKQNNDTKLIVFLS